MPGTLFVVATPIGNLEDITLRALRVLREVALVAAEDTRRTGNLLRHYEIETPLLSLHEHNERQRVPQILERLRTGQSIALVSDAGTPGISDPGAELVHAARAAGCAVLPVPGASALAAIVSVSGTTGPFTFLGFPPSKSSARREWFERVRTRGETAVILFESPHRLQATLSELARDLGDQPILVGREVTKLHEEWQSAPTAWLIEHFASPQGEFVLLVPGESKTDSPAAPPPDAEIYAMFGQLTNNADTARREAIRTVAERLGLSPNAVYEAIERARNSGD